MRYVEVPPPELDWAETGQAEEQPSWKKVKPEGTEHRSMSYDEAGFIFGTTALYSLSTRTDGDHVKRVAPVGLTTIAGPHDRNYLFENRSFQVLIHTAKTDHGGTIGGTGGSS